MLMKMRVYFIEQTWGDDHIAFYSPETGWMEYFDEYDAYTPFIYKTKKEMISETFNGKDRLDFVKSNIKFTYLGDL